MYTKQLNEIAFHTQQTDELLEQVIHGAVKNEAASLVRGLIKELDVLLAQEWVAIKGKAIYYNHKIGALLPDLKKFKLGYCTTYYSFEKTSFQKKFYGFTGELPTLAQFEQLFKEERRAELKKKLGWELPEWYSIAGPKAVNRYGHTRMFDCADKYDAYHVPIYSLFSKTEKFSCPSVLGKFIQHDLIPAGLSEPMENFYCSLKDLYRQHDRVLTIDNNVVVLDLDFLLEGCLTGKLRGLQGDLFDSQYVLAHQPLQLEEEQKVSLCTDLLQCDKQRCDLDEYDEKVLIDPNRGHWDLWERLDGDCRAVLDTPLMARNPVADVRADGVIGIDFGTKSTVVVYQEDSEYTLPMRIGTGKLGQEVEAQHFENPTVMEFIDLASFMESYQMESGRPKTKWEQVTTSHTAFSSLLHSDSQDYYSFLYELKQWAGDKQRRIRLRDKKGQDVVLPAFLDIEENAFNPIELYAYFIGLYINNMRNGIYLDYLLSFPVTYEKAVREKILESFQRGIKKSLPPSLLKEEALMESFRVSAGSSEPAAYAICALQEYGFAPECEEKVFYGVFDFGGGTTDFDFGVWREANSSERRYDYVVECFGAGGDKYLGGENLLELLAFEVLKDNQEVLRKEKIPFVLPPECNKFPGGETLLSDSQEAKINMTQMMEKLRPYWENHEGAANLFESGSLKVTLFDVSGVSKVNFELVVDTECLDEVIRQRIAKGIHNFFEGLRQAFAVPVIKDIETVHVFLAGNSCKSPVVKELFVKFAQEEAMKIDATTNNQDFFKLYPPLGSAEARALQQELGGPREEEDALRPTCKTGVAYGLIASRPGGKIQLIQHNNTLQEGEIRFRYYIGYEQKKRFTCLSDRELPYGEWKELIDAGAVDFTFFYTDLPEASTNAMDIKKVQRKKCRLRQAHAEANVYYRAVKPTVVEYVVARPEELAAGIYLEEIVALDFS